MTDAIDTPMERAVLVAVPFLVVGLVLSLPLLFVTWTPPPLTPVTVHLSGLVLLGLAAAVWLAPLAGADWFLGRAWSPWWRLAASGVTVVVISTGVVGLVTLASSAALRYPPSMQFLQLLSALDIAWAGAALVVGAQRAWGRPTAVAAGVVLGVACVFSIWRYLDMVGFGPAGEWIVDGPALWRNVIPADMAAGLVAVAVFVYGTRRVAAAPTGSPPG
ncbi:MAG: hypothetical protein BMS9Abin07_0248 [Acidimicrobiia bacterium]|nr:MAG: hypothetical protein BMS9Abin07_0248 [Acidimicrobiia bacterium]